MSNDNPRKKPTVFISHATSDGEFANVLKQEIEKVFENKLLVFCTSSPGAIQVGSDWLEEIEGKLKDTRAVIALITPTSVERPWLWFEVGATWLSSRRGDCRIYPLCTPEIEMGSLPSPLDRLQALSMGKSADLKLFFEALIKHFKVGKISLLRTSNITKRIPKYKEVKIEEVDRNEKHFYSGRYSGYSDQEFMEVIDTNFIHPLESQTFSLDEREDRIRGGKLIHFRGVDSQLDLPPGTSKRLLVPTAERYNLIPALMTEHLVRFKRKPYEYDDDEDSDDEDESEN